MALGARSWTCGDHSDRFEKYFAWDLPRSVAPAHHPASPIYLKVLKDFIILCSILPSLRWFSRQQWGNPFAEQKSWFSFLCKDISVSYLDRQDLNKSGGVADILGLAILAGFEEAHLLCAKNIKIIYIHTYIEVKLPKVQKYFLFYLLNRRQPIPTEEASSQLPLQPALASQPARRKAERRARERERQEPTFIAGELRVILSWRNVSLRTVASDKATLLCNLRILPFYSTTN